MRDPILMRVGDTLWPGYPEVAMLRLRGNVNAPGRHKKSPPNWGALILYLAMVLGSCLNTIAGLGLARRYGGNGDTASIAVLEGMAWGNLARFIHMQPDLVFGC